MQASIGKHIQDRSGELHDDFLVEILFRLPLKALCRCNCVSRRWRRLVQATYTQRVYFSLFLYGYPFLRPNPIKELTILSEERSLVHVPNLVVTDACNGFFLESGCSKPPSFSVSNPLTGKTIILPSCTRDHLPHLDEYCPPMLAFDPRITPHYKVILFFALTHCLPLNKSCEVAIFSSEVRKWRFLAINLAVENKMAGCLVATVQTICVNGYAYRLSCIGLFAEEDGKVNLTAYVLAFHISEEHFRLISLPKGKIETGMEMSLGESRSHLQFIYNDQKHMKIWALEDSGPGGWILRHKICMEKLCLKILKFCLPAEIPRVDLSRISGLASHPDMEAIFVLSVDTVFCYHLKDSRLERVCSFVEPLSKYSLVSFLYCLNNPDL